MRCALFFIMQLKIDIVSYIIIIIGGGCKLASKVNLVFVPITFAPVVNSRKQALLGHCTIQAL